MQKKLIIGYGNPDREDDGVGWHILEQLAIYFGHPVSVLDYFESDEPPANPHLVFSLQLMPEMAEPMAAYHAVCFVDAHTGNYPEEIRVRPLESSYQSASFTHHLTPESCLALAETLYGHAPEGLMVSVRGYNFGYGTELSPQTTALIQQAVVHIIDWVKQT